MDLTPNLELQNSVAELVRADTTILASASAMFVKLSKTSFTPGPNQVPGDFTEADFDGYGAIQGTAGAQTGGIDPLTGQTLITINEAGDPWFWQVTGLTNLPQTIYGAYLTNNGGTKVWGSVLFLNPIPLSAIGQQIDIGNLMFRLPLQPLGPA